MYGCHMETKSAVIGAGATVLLAGGLFFGIGAVNAASGSSDPAPSPSVTQTATPAETATPSPIVSPSAIPTQEPVVTEAPAPVEQPAPAPVVVQPAPAPVVVQPAPTAIPDPSGVLHEVAPVDPSEVAKVPGPPPIQDQTSGPAYTPPASAVITTSP